MTDVMHLP